MLEMVRQYASEKLAAAGERARYQALHADYFRRLAANARPIMKGTRWETPLRAEQENLRLALAASFSDQAEAEDGPNLLLQMLEHGLLSEPEVEAWSERATGWLVTHPNIAARSRIRITRLAANLLAAPDLPAAVAALRQVVEDSRRLGSEYTSDLVWSLDNLSRLLASLNEVDAAWAALTEAEERFSTIDPKTLEPGEISWTRAVFAGAKARLANKQGKYAEARAFSNEHLRLLRERGEPEGNFDVWLEMGHTSLDLKEYDAAHQQFLRARTFALAYAAGSPASGVAYVNRCLGLVALGKGELEQALHYSHESLKEAQRGPFHGFIASSVGLAACVAARLGHPLRAARLSGAAASLYARTGRSAWEDSTLDTLLPGWRQGPDEAAVRQAYVAGQALSMEEAVAYALNEAAA
jgi:tetratricopeptide (TPR) repeat protein